LHGSETWPVRKENVVALQRAEMRMVRWMCGVKLKDRLPNKESLHPQTTSLQVHTPNGISIGSAAFTWLVLVTNRQIYTRAYTHTDRAFCVAIGHLLCYAW